MVVDHVGCIFFPTYRPFRIVGRLAFPIFAFFVAESIYFTNDKKKYLYRLLLLTLISEPIFDIAFSFKVLHIFNQNIYATLLNGALTCFCIEKLKPYVGYCSYMLALPVGMLTEFIRADYGYYGIFLIVMFYFFRDIDAYNKVIPKFFVPTLVLILGCFVSAVRGGLWVQDFSVVAGFLLPPQKKDEKHMSKIWYLFYPGHLMVLFLLKKIVF